MNTCELLERISLDERLTSAEHIEVKEDLKKIFYGSNGYMAWRKKQESLTGGSFNVERSCLLELFIETNSNQEACEFVEDALQEIYWLALQHLNARLFGVIDNLTLWHKARDFSLKGSELDVYNKILSILKLGEREQRDRIILLLGVYAEGSISQARKSLAGSGGELVIEALLNSYGLIKNKDYGTQFSSEGSDTDIVIPYAKKPEDVLAYIAIQISSNDRTRLTTSELVSGKLNYFISFNGCSASTKNTDDIGDEIISKYTQENIFYVITTKERERAIASSNERLKREKNKTNPSQRKINFTKTRIEWLETKSITFKTFINQILEL